MLKSGAQCEFNGWELERKCMKTSQIVSSSYIVTVSHPEEFGQ